MKKIPIAIFASGRGSNFEALAQAVDESRLEAEIKYVICDKAGAGVIDKAKKRGIKVIEIFEKKGEASDTALERVLNNDPVHFAVLAGYMRILGPKTLNCFRSPKGYFRIVNIHPSLLPAFPGMNAYEAAWNHGCDGTGVTVHLVDEGLDEGPICAQEYFSIRDCRSAQDVEKKGLRVEHQIFAQALTWILNERFEIEKRKGRICVRPS